jgi:hypothetical protein
MDWFPGLTTEEEKAQQRQQDAAEQARQAMRVYQSSSNGNLDPAPAFTAPQALDASIGALPLTDARAGGGAAPAAALRQRRWVAAPSAIPRRLTSRQSIRWLPPSRWPPRHSSPRAGPPGRAMPCRDRANGPATRQQARA